MARNLMSVFFGMLFAGHVWEVYGAGLPVQSSVYCENCHVTSKLDYSVSTRSFETPIPALSMATGTQPYSSPLVTAPATSPVGFGSPVSPTTHSLGAGAKAAMGLGISVIVILVLAILILGIPHIRSRQRTRALQRAVDEVERGVEMPQTIGHGSEAPSEGKENMVLESRVEIVVDDGQSERNAVEMWDGWDATWSEDDDLERGRKGMSLPRREY